MIASYDDLMRRLSVIKSTESDIASCGRVVRRMVVCRSSKDNDMSRCRHKTMYLMCHSTNKKRGVAVQTDNDHVVNQVDDKFPGGTCI